MGFRALAFFCNERLALEQVFELVGIRGDNLLRCPFLAFPLRHCYFGEEAAFITLYLE